MQVKSESEVAQSSPTLSDPVDCSPPGSSIYGIFQARVLEWGAIVGVYVAPSPALPKSTELSGAPAPPWLPSAENSFNLGYSPMC